MGLEVVGQRLDPVVLEDVAFGQTLDSQFLRDGQGHRRDMGGEHRPSWSATDPVIEGQASTAYSRFILT